MGVDVLYFPGREKVTCILCPQSLLIPTFNPYQGHMGEEIPENQRGPYLNFRAPAIQTRKEKRDYRLFHEGAWFTLVREKGILKVISYEFGSDFSLYAKHKYVFPEIGLGIDLVFWVCPHCKKLADMKAKEDKEDESLSLQQILSKKSILYFKLEKAEKKYRRNKMSPQKELASS